MMANSTTHDALGSSLRKEINALLDGGLAHASFAQAVKGFPAELRGVVPQGLPYSAWQILEHIRIAQKDMLEFSDNADGGYKKKEWPAAYWPTSPEPPNDTAWDEAIAAIDADRQAFDDLLASASDEELVTPFPWGSGQTLLREALQIADHNAYHVGELIVVRRLLGAWKK